METKSKPPAPDIFVAYETPAVNSVDQLGDADFHGPFPSSAFEVIQNHQINHERDDDTEKLTSNSTNCIRPQNYCGITTVLQNRDLRSMNVPSALCMKLNLPILQQFLDVSYIFCTIPFTRIHASLCLRYFQCVSKLHPFDSKLMSDSSLFDYLFLVISSSFIGLLWGFLAYTLSSPLTLLTREKM